MKQQPASTTTEVIGWAGIALIIAAYALVSASLLTAADWQYQLMNLVGATAVIWMSYRKGVAQTLLLNIFWAAIAGFALVSLLIRHA